MAPAQNTYLLLDAGGRRCALPATAVKETMRPLPVEPVVNAPAFALGMAVIRGAATPVLDLGVLLGGERVPHSRFVTLRAGDHTVALAATAVLGLREIQDKDIAQMPPLLSGAEPGAADHIALRDGVLLNLLN